MNCGVAIGCEHVWHKFAAPGVESATDDAFDPPPAAAADMLLQAETRDTQ